MSRVDRSCGTSPLLATRTMAGLLLLTVTVGSARRALPQSADRDTALSASGLATLAPSRGLLSEIRTGVLAHDLPVLGPQREHGGDLNAEVLFLSPVPDHAVSGIPPAARWLLQPRPQLGVTGNLSGYTSQAYVGLDWTVQAARRLLRSADRLLFDVGFGGAFNNDRTSASMPNRALLGSNLLFHPSLQIGYGIDARYSVGLYYEHSSNAHLAKVNEGLNNIGLRFGRRL